MAVVKRTKVFDNHALFCEGFDVFGSLEKFSVTCEDGCKCFGSLCDRNVVMAHPATGGTFNM